MAATGWLVLFGIGLLIVGMNPSDTEMQLAFWPAVAVGFAVTMRLTLRGSPDPDK